MEAVINAVFNPSQIPHMTRCDNETAIANSKEFTKYLQDLDVHFEPTSTAELWEMEQQKEQFRLSNLACKNL
jgi:hypothetical protein